MDTLLEVSTFLRAYSIESASYFRSTAYATIGVKHACKAASTELEI
jgi:hypothetical protein